MNQHKKEKNYTNYSPVSSEDNEDNPNRTSNFKQNKDSNQTSNLNFLGLFLPIIDLTLLISIQFKSIRHRSQACLHICTGHANSCVFHLHLDKSLQRL